MLRPLLPLLALLALAPALLHAEEVKLERDGLTLNANLEPTGDDWPNGPVVLLTHGTLAHNGMEIVVAQQQLLLERGISSLAINLSLGLNDRHGMYDCAVTHRHRHLDALDEIAAWADWLQRRGVERIVLFGHSRGGNQTAWFAAERDRPTVAGVVLVAPMTWSATEAAAGYRKRYDSELAPLLERAEAMVAAGSGDQLMEGIGFVYCKEASATAAAFVDYYRDDPRKDTPALLARIPKPTLVVIGSADRVVEGLEERVAPMADGEKVKMVVIEAAEHFFRDLNGDELADAVAEFIATLDG